MAQFKNGDSVKRKSSQEATDNYPGWTAASYSVVAVETGKPSSTQRIKLRRADNRERWVQGIHFEEA